FCSMLEQTLMVKITGEGHHYEWQSNAGIRKQKSCSDPKGLPNIYLSATGQAKYVIQERVSMTTTILLSCIILTSILLISLSSFFGAKSETSERAWTILLYGAVDNSADDPFVEFTDQVRRAIDDDPGIELVLFIDRSNAHEKRATFLGEDFTGARLYRIK